MSEYPENLRLYPLQRETLQQVVQYAPFYRAYIDALALIHDLLCEFTDSLEKPYFTPGEVEEQKGRVISNLYTAGVNRNPRFLVENIEANFRLARNIRSSAEHTETPGERFQAELRATQFMNSLLQTYTTLRILKQYGEPAHL